jgi:hypothetical protein
MSWSEIVIKEALGKNNFTRFRYEKLKNNGIFFAAERASESWIYYLGCIRWITNSSNLLERRVIGRFSECLLQIFQVFGFWVGVEFLNSGNDNKLEKPSHLKISGSEGFLGKKSHNKLNWIHMQRKKNFPFSKTDKFFPSKWNKDRKETISMLYANFIWKFILSNECNIFFKEMNFQ